MVLVTKEKDEIRREFSVVKIISRILISSLKANSVGNQVFKFSETKQRRDIVFRTSVTTRLVCHYKPFSSC